MNRRPVRSIAIAVFLLLADYAKATAASAPYCDALLDRTPDSPMAYKDRGDRCEGLYIKQVASTTLLIASFTESFEEFDPASGKALRIEWAKVPGNPNLHLRAHGLKRRLYYRMDAAALNGISHYDWPSDILASLGVHRSDIGVVGISRSRVGTVEHDIYVPLQIRQATDATRTDTYKLIVVPGVELQELYLSVDALTGDGRVSRVLKEGQPLGYGFYPAERGVEIPVSGMTGAGLYRVRIGATVRSGGTSTVELWFLQP